MSAGLGPGLEAPEKISFQTRSVGRIPFPAVVGFRVLFSYRLLSGSHSQPLKTTHLSLPVAPLSSKPTALQYSSVLSVSDFLSLQQPEKTLLLKISVIKLDPTSPTLSFGK